MAAVAQKSAACNPSTATRNFFKTMARYTGPRVRISRRFWRADLWSVKYLERRNYGPGMHGPSPAASRRIRSGPDRKAEARYYYGLMERQFRGVYERALKRRGITVNRCSRFWRRVWTRLLPSRFRQHPGRCPPVVGHGHVKVNGRRSTSRPSG